MDASGRLVFFVSSIRLVGADLPRPLSPGASAVPQGPPVQRAPREQPVLQDHQVLRERQAPTGHQGLPDRPELPVPAGPLVRRDRREVRARTGS